VADWLIPSTSIRILCSISTVHIQPLEV
jgi:hypothetical protein